MAVLVGVAGCPSTIVGNAANGKADFNGTGSGTTFCAICHNGIGAPLPQNLDASEVQSDMGNVDAAMDGIDLTAQQVADIKAYLTSLKTPV
jgi:mono/diheme cytochrome c family protein